MRATISVRFYASVLMIVPLGGWITLDLMFKNTNDTFLDIEVKDKEFKESESNCFKVEERSHAICKLMSVVHVGRITFVKISDCSAIVDNRFDCFLQFCGSDLLVLEFYYLCLRDTVSINFENLENFIVRKTNFSLLLHLRSSLYDLCHSYDETEVVLPLTKTPQRNELYCSKLSCAKDEIILNVSSGQKLLKENLHIGRNVQSCSKFFKNYGKTFQRARRSAPNRPPSLNSKHFITNVLEEQPPGLVLSINISATDPDEGDAARLRYSLHAAKDQRSQSLFEINSFTGTVSTTQKLDRESMGTHFFRVVAQDSGKPKMSAEAYLTIYVKDFNDHAPIFERDLYAKSVSENLGAGGELLTVHAIDGDSEENGEITYRILNEGEMEGMFEINPQTGLVTITSRLDREKRDFYKLKIMAIDGALMESKLSATATVEVTVQDENDNSPQFLNSPYHFDIKEDIEYLNTPFVGDIKAIDADLDKNALLRYSITSGNSLGHFMIDPNNGSLFLIGPLDYEKTSSYTLFVKAQDQGNPPKSNTTFVTITILDSNDNEPKFDVPYYHDFISENIPIGSNIFKIRAHDADSGPFGNVAYLIRSEDDLPFSINAQGNIATTKEIDREVQSIYRFEVVACDSGGDSKKCSSAIVEITVRDVNDNPPIFEHKIYNSSVSEDTPPGSIAETVRAADADEDVNGRITYSIVSGNDRGSFSILNQVGYATLIVAKTLNYKEQNKYALVVSATDNTFEGTATIFVSVQDVNLNRPVFLGTPYHLRLPEDTSIGQVVFSVSAFDADSGNNAKISYSLSPNEAFSVNEVTGEMMLASSLDREAKAGYTLTVTAVDHGHPPKFDFADIEILIADVNDNPPLFVENSYRASVSEDSFVGANVLTVQARDADEGLNKRIKYVLDDHIQDFKIESMLGIIRTAKELDREKVADYNLMVYAVDGGEPALTGSVSVKIEVLDVNDNAPVFESSNLVFYIEENVPVGFHVGEIKAFDLDDGPHAEMMFSILPGPDSESFTLDSFNGNTFLISTVELDFESTKKEFFVDVRARSHHLFTDATIKVVVTDVNDNLPVVDDFIILFNNYKDHFNLGFVGKVPAYDPDVNDNLRFKFVYGNQGRLLHLNETSGIMRLDSRLNSDVPTNGTLVISVSDGINEVRATCKLYVRLVTEEMMAHSIQIQIADVDPVSFLGIPYKLLISAVAAIVPSAEEDVLVIDVQSDSSRGEENLALNVSFAVRHSSNQGVDFFSQEFLKEKVHLLRHLLMKLSLMKILPFEDDLCVQEPCLNFEDCTSILRFNVAADVISSQKMFFRPLRSSTIFTCQCPQGFTGMNYQFLCDVEVNLCFSNPCHNGGTCLQTEGGYQCSCLSEFTGVRCEVDLKSKNVELSPGYVCKPPSVRASRIGEGFECRACDARERCTDCRDRPGSNEFCEMTTRSFIGRSYLMFPSIHKKHRFNITLRFATKSVDGMLLYNGRFNGLHDFILLQICNKQLHFSFSLGSQVTTVTTFVKGGVSTGQWVEATVLYFNRTATLVVGVDCNAALSSKLGENCTNTATQQLERRCEDVTEICHRLLDLTGPLLIGGMPFPAFHNSSIISSHYFTGCISNLSIDSKFIDLNSFASENLTMPGCAPKKNFCASAVCENGGVCRNAWGGYKCICRDGFTHKNCKVQVPLVDQALKLNGNGFISFSSEQHGLTPVRHPWFISFHLRTTQTHSQLFHIEILGREEIHSSEPNLSVKLVEGRIECAQPDFSSYRLDEVINDGDWHHVQMAWSNNHLNFDLDHGLSRVSYLIEDTLQGHQIGRIVFGGRPNGSGDDVEMKDGFEGCVKSIRIGSNSAVVLADREEHNVERGCSFRDMCSLNLHNCHPNTSTCLSIFNNFSCICNKGYAGPDCSRNVCEVYEPCDENKTKCLLNFETLHGYECKCVAEKCHLPPAHIGCPVSWWGSPVCGPCNCPIMKGFSPNCDQKTGKCLCKPNHYLKGSECLPCDCYDIGSLSLTCDVFTGQCPCRSNVIGRQCDLCASKMAQVTNQGCEVVYTGCPKSFHKNVWWHKTPWNSMAVSNCPVKMVGTATRFCNESHGWDEPHVGNCSSLVFADLKQVLAALDSHNLEVNTYVSKDILSRLKRATDVSGNRMTARDVEVTRNLLVRILSYEIEQSGLDMVHSRDRHFIKNLVDVVGNILDVRYSEEWHFIHVQQPNATSVLVSNIFKYLEVLTNNMQILFTQPFDAIHKNFLLGLDWISGSYPDSHVKLPKFNNKLKQEMVLDFHTHIKLPFASSDHRNKTLEASIYFGYIIFKHLGTILPLNYDERLRRQLTSRSAICSEIFHIYMIDGSDSTHAKPKLSILPVVFENIPRTKHANPRCVMFNQGIWAQKGCKLEEGNAVVCLCNSISTYAVVTEVIGEDLNMEPFVLDAACYTILIVSTILILCAFIVFFFINTVPTIANIIHLNLSANMLLSFFIFLLSIDRVHNKELCRISAIFIHLFWLNSHSWLLVMLCHLFRRMTDVRDVNHGNMQFYYIIGYVVPGVIVSLAVGLDTDAYGSNYFCWILQKSILSWAFIAPIICCFILSVIILLVSLYSFIGGKSKHADGDLRYFKYGLQAGCIMLILMSLSSMFLAISLNHAHILACKYLFLAFALLQSVFLVVAYIIFSQETQRQLHYVWYKTIGHKNDEDALKSTKRRPKSQSLHSGSSCEDMHYNKPSEMNASQSSRSKQKKIHALPQDQQVLHPAKDVRMKEDDEYVVELHERPTIDSEESEISALERRIEDFTSSDEDENWSAPQLSERTTGMQSSKTKKPPFNTGSLRRTQQEFVDSTSSGSEYEC